MKLDIVTPATVKSIIQKEMSSKIDEIFRIISILRDRIEELDTQLLNLRLIVSENKEFRPISPKPNKQKSGVSKVRLK